MRLRTSMTDTAQALTAQQLRALMAASQLQPLPVDVPGWGTVMVKRMTVADVDAAALAKLPEGLDPAELERMRTARGVAAVVCDASGQRIFDPNNLDDLRLISAQPWDEMSRIIEASSGLNGGDPKNG
jgi:hypothetical protein